MAADRSGLTKIHPCIPRRAIPATGRGVSQSIYELLHSWNYSFEYTFHQEAFEFSEGSYVPGDWYAFTQQDLDLANFYYPVL